MALVCQAGVGHVDADPAACGHVQANICPGVAGQVGLVGGIKVTTDVTRRVAKTAADGDHHMGLVLAHALASVEGIQCSRGDV